MMIDGNVPLAVKSTKYLFAVLVRRRLVKEDGP